MCPLSQSVVVKIRRGGEWRQENVARINVVCTADTILYKQTILYSGSQTLREKIRYLIVCSVQCASLSYIKDGGDIYQGKLSSLLSEGNQKLWAECSIYSYNVLVLYT